MGLLETLERFFLPSRAEEKIHVDLKEIYCKRKDDAFIKRIRTSAVGCAYNNPDGSDRQKIVAKLKAGERIRLIWEAADAKKDPTVYLVRKGASRQLNMTDCFGRLNDRVASEIVRKLTRENVVTSATVVRLTGGTRKNSKRSCILELTLYPGPKKGAPKS